MKNDKQECDFRSYGYEGIDPTSYAWMNSNTQFVYGFRFYICEGNDMSGVSLAKSALNLYLFCNTENSVPTRTTYLSLDLFYQIGGFLVWNMAGLTATF